jgi:hypothetical protein
METFDLVCGHCQKKLGVTTTETQPVVYCKTHGIDHTNPSWREEWHDLAPRARVAAHRAAKAADITQRKALLAALAAAPTVTEEVVVEDVVRPPRKGKKQ